MNQRHIIIYEYMYINDWNVKCVLIEDDTGPVHRTIHMATDLHAPYSVWLTRKLYFPTSDCLFKGFILFLYIVAHRILFCIVVYVLISVKICRVVIS